MPVHVFLQIEISVKKATPEANTLRDVMKSKGVPVIRQKIGEYIQALKDGKILHF